MKALVLLALLAAAGCTRPAAPTPAPETRKAAFWNGWDFTIGQGSTNVRWSRPVFDATGNPVDVTGATVVFRYRLINQSADAVQHAGSVTGTFPPRAASYLFTSADTATPGDYNVSFIVTLPIADGGADGSAETFAYPTDRFLKLQITPAP